MIPLSVDDAKSIDEQFREAEAEWKTIRLRGSDTGCWTDGMCMNLIRSKMVRLLKLKKSEKDMEDFSEWEIPEKVDYEYNHRESFKNGKRSRKGTKHHSLVQRLDRGGLILEETSEGGVRGMEEDCVSVQRSKV